MSDKMRWRYGDTNPVVAAVNADIVIEIGDLVWQDINNAKSASFCSSQAAFCNNFLGVAMQRSRYGETTPIRVATTGVFEFDCPLVACELGDLTGPDHVNNVLMNQQVMMVTAPWYAIGRVAKRQPEVVRSVLVDIRSTLMTGGIR
jgi:hypothetical protein